MFYAKQIYQNCIWDTKTLPVGGDMVIKYTKHYYIGSERISSATGTDSYMGVFINGLYTSGFFPAEIVEASEAIVEVAGDALEEAYSSFGLDYTVPEPDTTYGLSGLGNISFFGENVGRYFFHPDHLGSSSYITNLAGVVSQHMEYLPFGELLVDEHLNSHNSPFKFNAKELDAETGNYYYGARYYDPKWSTWLSVDPLAEVMPSGSPYVYTFNNPIRYTDPTGMIPENSGGGCPTPCDDPKIYPYTAGEQQLDPVVISTDKASNNSISFSGAMPDWMNRMEVGHYETSFKGDINDYNRRNGTNYSLGNGYMQWYYDYHYKQQYDELIADRNEAGKYFGYGFVGALAAPFALGALSTSGFSLLLNSGYKGFFARVSLDASIQYGITGDVDLIGATASGIGFKKYGLMANAVGASADYTVFGGQFRDVFGTKSLSHAAYDFMGSFGPNLGRAVSSPGNSLGPVGIEAIGNLFGTFMSHKLKNQ